MELSLGTLRGENYEQKLKVINKSTFKSGINGIPFQENQKFVKFPQEPFTYGMSLNKFTGNLNETSRKPIYNQPTLTNEGSSIKYIQFGALSEEDIRAFAVKQIKKPHNKGGSTDDTAYDSALGVIENDVPCITCGKKNTTGCAGHYGYIELAEPMFNIKYLDIVMTLLRIVCLECHNIKLSKNKIDLFCSSKSGEERIKEIRKKCVTLECCECCGKKIPKFTKKNNTIYITRETTEINNSSENPNEFKKDISKPSNGKIIKTTTNKSFYKGVNDKDFKLSLNGNEVKTETKILSAKKVYNTFKLLNTEQIKLLGFNSKLPQNELFCDPKIVLRDGKTHIHEVLPSSFLFKAFLVLPICARPWIIKGSEKIDDDITGAYDTIIKSNNKLLDIIVGGKEIYKKRNGKNELQDKKTIRKEIQTHINSVIDNSKKNGKQNMNNHSSKGISERIDHKDGQAQLNVGGKRSDLSARAVICSGGSQVNMGYFGISEYMAQNLTIKRRVTPWNYDYYKQLLQEGKINSIIKLTKKGGKETINIRLRNLYYKTKIINVDLKIGDYVKRQLQNGDWIVINRQPSLRLESQEAAQVHILKGEACERLNPGDTRAFNADYDGDLFH